MGPYVRPEDAEDPAPREDFAPPRDEEARVRTFPIFKQDVADSGPTDGCKGCRPHSARKKTKKAGAGE